MLTACDRATEKGRRDYALLRLMFDRGLRRGEAIGLDIDQVDVTAGTIKIQAKGKLDRDVLTVNPSTPEALQAVIDDATDDPDHPVHFASPLRYPWPTDRPLRSGAFRYRHRVGQLCR